MVKQCHYILVKKRFASGCSSDRNVMGKTNCFLFGLKAYFTGENLYFVVQI